MKLKINIVQCHHKKYEFIKNEIIQPIHVGAALSKTTLDYCIRDDEGENISVKNPNWCELTALYWQWKNVDADYYGLFHYRRLLSFTKSGGIEDNLNNFIQKKYKLTAEKIKNTCMDCDIILPKKEKIYSVSNYSKNINLYDQYALDHHIEDLDDVFEIIKLKYPEVAQFIPKLKILKECYYGNIFIMKSIYYKNYCSFLFDVLLDLEIRLNIDNRNPYQSRVYGFISERLLNLYILYLIDNKNIKIKELNLLYLSQSRPLKINFIDKKSTIISDININVCMAFDNNYFDHGMVVIKSIIDNTKSFVNLYILDGGDISRINKQRCIDEFKFNKISIFFVKVNKDLIKNFPLNMGYISISTYYRLFLREVLVNLNKVIYIDADVVVKGDIKELWDAELGDKIIGACYDELGVYQERRLGFPAKASYFNAGVIVFNIYELNKKYSNILDFYKNIYLVNGDKIIFQDQDILNLAHYNDVRILDIKWNMGSGMFLKNINDVKYSQKNIEESILSPGIIHYTGAYKPWNFFCNNPTSYLYWFYFKKLNNKKWSFLKLINYFNNTYLCFGYRVNGDYIDFHLLGRNFFRIKKSILNKVKTNA